MIRFFKKLDKTLTSVAVSSKALVEHIENIDLTKERSLTILTGDIYRTLTAISAKLDKIIEAQAPLSRYFEFELKWMKEKEAAENIPPGKHDDLF